MPSKRAKNHLKTPLFMRYSEICLIGGCLICGAYQQKNKGPKVGTFQFLPWREGCLISGCALVKLNCTFKARIKNVIEILLKSYTVVQWYELVVSLYNWERFHQVYNHCHFICFTLVPVVCNLATRELRTRLLLGLHLQIRDHRFARSDGRKALDD